MHLHIAKLTHEIFVEDSLMNRCQVLNLCINASKLVLLSCPIIKILFIPLGNDLCFDFLHLYPRISFLFFVFLLV